MLVEGRPPIVRFGLVGWTVTPPSVFGCDSVAGGTVVDGGGAEAEGPQLTAGGMLDCDWLDMVSCDNAPGSDRPGVGRASDGVDDGGVDSVGAGVVVEP